MNFDSIELLAAVLIVIAAVKVIVMIINPQLWLKLVGKIYTVPAIVTIVGFVLSLLVLYFIVNSGISIVEILAVCLFIALLMMMGLANYADELISWFKAQEFFEVIKKLWLYSAIWIFLIVWGAYALLSK
ncbi:MAG: hypothetical protein AB8B89_05385 [Gammaproteobacteria bacterium]